MRSGGHELPEPPHPQFCRDEVVEWWCYLTARQCSQQMPVVALPDAAVPGRKNPATVDQHPAAVVVSTGLQADLPGPEEGAGLSHVHHRHLTVLGCSQSREDRSLQTARALLFSTPVLCQNHNMLKGPKYSPCLDLINEAGEVRTYPPSSQHLRTRYSDHLRGAQTTDVHTRISPGDHSKIIAEPTHDVRYPANVL